MKKFLLCAAALTMATTMVAKNGEIVLDLTNPSTEINYVDDGSGKAQIWDGCYSGGDGVIDYGIFSFSHHGEDMYWHGFCPSISDDVTNYNEAGEAFYVHAWNPIAGGGIKTNEAGEVETDDAGKVAVDPSAPLMTGYWSFYDYLSTDLSTQVIFNDGNSYEAKGMYVTNNCYPYYSFENGDGFARAFNQEGDSFKLIAIGLDENYEETDNQVELELASYNNGQLSVINDWQWMDLSALGEVHGINFTMSTTDEGQWGPNTACYFCMDKLTVIDPSVATAVTERKTAKTVAGVDYVNMAGQRASTPFAGVNVVVTRYTDGSMSTAKVVK